MRNWNISYSSIFAIDWSTLYLTYEELKLASYVLFFARFFLLYLTYEELKPDLIVGNIDGTTELYLTYEELKPGVIDTLCSLWRCVVPYLWGIETYSPFFLYDMYYVSLYLTYEELKRIV